MSYSTPSSTKILNLTTAPFQLVPCLSVNFLWCQECIFYCAPMKKKYSLLPKGTDIYTHSAAQPSKRFRLLSVTILLWQGHCLIEKKTQTRNLTVFIVFVIRPSFFSLRDRQQTAFVTLNRFCPLGKLPPLLCS